MNEPIEQSTTIAHRPRTRGDEVMNAQLGSIVRTMAEMEQGLRPVGALDTIASPLAARRIRQIVHGARMSGTGTQMRRGRVVPPRVIATVSSQPAIGVTEGVVVIACEDRTRPYCVRLEQEGDRWRVVELAPPDAGLRPAITEASRTGAVPVDDDGVRRSSGRGGVPFCSLPLPDERVIRVEQLGRTEGSADPDGGSGRDGATGTH